MNAISINQFHCLRVSFAALSIVAGCIIIGVSSSCSAEAVGGIFLGAGALGLIIRCFGVRKLAPCLALPGFIKLVSLDIGLMISIYPFIRAWLDFNQVLPLLGNLRIHPQPPGIDPGLPSDSYTREGMASPFKQELPNRPKYPDKNIPGINLPVEGASAENQQPDIIMKRKFTQQSGDSTQ